jgi:predicted short-subunit dehydrogenase-like oxidoreductase (DUF2520 family)
MNKQEVHKVAIIGAGNLATNLGLALKKERFKIVEVYNRTRENGEILAKKVEAHYVNDLTRLTLNADLYIISVSDNAIHEIAQHLFLSNKLVVHTSGSVDMDILKGCSMNVGVLYSPQTFIKSRPVSFKNLPVCIEASNSETEQALLEIAGKLSGNVQSITSGQRSIIHLAAVFAGNFTNFMYTVSEELLMKNNLSFDLVKPIILQTASNVKEDHNFKRQTGPAVREDSEILKKHKTLLNSYPDYQQIYDLISGSIIKHKHTNEQL